MTPTDPPGRADARRVLRSRIAIAAAALVVVLVAGGLALQLLRPAPSSEPVPTVPPTAAFSGPPVGSFPTSGAVVVSHRSNVRISGRTFRGIVGTPAIVIDHSSGVVIDGNDFIDDSEPIYVVSSTDITITGNRYVNIVGPHERDGSHRGNFTQWVDSTGGSIVGNRGAGGDTEDIVSIYRSGGHSAADPLLIADNVFVGTDWTSSSGSGILVGDNGSSHVVVRGNTLVNPGQVGIGIAGGTDIVVTGNTVNGEPRTSSNVGIYVWNLSNAPCSGITVRDNTIRFRKADGTRSDLYDGGGCGTIAGWSTNSAG